MRRTGGVLAALTLTFAIACGNTESAAAPDVTGLPYNEAVEQIEAAGIDYRTVGNRGETVSLRPNMTSWEVVGQEMNDGTLTMTVALREPAPARTGTQTYESASEIHQDLIDRHVACTAFKQREGGWFMLNSGSCWMDGTEIVLGIFATPQEINAYVNEIFGLLDEAGMGYGYVSGQNWFVNCDTREFCDEIRGALGGKKFVKEEVSR